MLTEREELYTWAHQQLQEFAARHGERLLHTPGNPISMAMTVSGLQASTASEGVTVLGSMLFNCCASGARVVGRGKAASVAGFEFQGYGAHCDAYPHDYLTVAAALGTRKDEITGFLEKLEKVIAKLKRKNSRQSVANADA